MFVYICSGERYDMDMKQGQNIFVAFLELLNVKHTKTFSNQHFDEHPHKYNLFGLSKMLQGYGIDNAATRVSNKETDITEIQTPFIAQFGGSFVLVHKVTSEGVSFLSRGLTHTLPVAKFMEAWSGVVLLAEPSPTSIEPDYQKHRNAEVLDLVKKGLFAAATVFLLSVVYLASRLFTNIGVSLLLLINLTGVFISCLLMLKHLRIHSQYADKICSLFKQSNCNSVLESNAAKLFGVIGWSEVHEVI